MENKFPERLKKLRERNRLKQCVLSELCGLNRNAIKRYEAGNAEPTMTSLERIADYFNTSVDYLLGRTDYPRKI